MFLIERECDEAIMLVHLCFMDASTGPLVPFVDATADADPAGDQDRQMGVDSLQRVEGEHGKSGTLRFLGSVPETLERPCAGHVQLQTDAAAHRRAQHVFAVGPRVAGEVPFAFALRNTVPF